jgi:cytochrome P450
VDVFRRVPLLKVFPLLLRPSGLMEQRKEMFRLSMEKAKARIEKGNDRDDFFGHLLSEKAPDTTIPYLTIQANTLLVAGSETTATLLTGICYSYLMN